MALAPRRGAARALLFADLPREGDLGEAADALAGGLRPHLGGPGELTLLLIFDATFPRVGSFLDELYLRLADRVRYMGANAGSESFKPIPCLFDAERVVGGGVLAVLLKGSRGAVLEHGYEVPSRMIAATSTDGNRIMQIGWRPAFEVYQAMGRAVYGAEITRENFYECAVHFPFGIVRANGTILVRIPVALEGDGSLYCAGEVPANSMLALLAAPLVDSTHTVDTLVRGLREMGGPTAGRELLLFYCAGRRLHLGLPGAEREVRQLELRSEAARVAGALSLGEIGTTSEWATRSSTTPRSWRAPGEALEPRAHHGRALRHGRTSCWLRRATAPPPRRVSAASGRPVSARRSTRRASSRRCGRTGRNSPSSWPSPP